MKAPPKLQVVRMNPSRKSVKRRQGSGIWIPIRRFDLLVARYPSAVSCYRVKRDMGLKVFLKIIMRKYPLNKPGGRIYWTLFCQFIDPDELHIISSDRAIKGCREFNDQRVRAYQREAVCSWPYLWRAYRNRRKHLLLYGWARCKNVTPSTGRTHRWEKVFNRKSLSAKKQVIHRLRLLPQIGEQNAFTVTSIAR